MVTEYPFGGCSYFVLCSYFMRHNFIVDIALLLFR